MRWMFMPLWRCFDFSGRSRRTEFLMFFLLPLIAMTAFVVWMMRIFIAIGREGDNGQVVDAAAGQVGLAIESLGIFMLVMLIPTLAVQVRRFHDQGLSGWLVLLNLIPTVGNFIVLVFMCLRGTEGDNRFGADPRTAGE